MKLNKLFLISALMLGATQMISAMTLRGVVLDQETGEPLLGAAVMVMGTTMGTSTGFDGDFELKVDPGQQVVVSYISYVTKEITTERGEKDIEVRLAPDTQTLASVEVVTKANLETEANLQRERLASHVAIENLGVREMSLKGISNVEDGVKTITGISVEEAGQVFVRGLGDRYSLTTMNGLPIASPNPDNKLIPLDLFPSSVVKNITVSKVYQASAFGDYSGALIDIATKDIVSDDFFTISAGVGMTAGTTGKEFYTGDRGSLFSTSQLDKKLQSISGSKSQVTEYLQSKDPFGTDFSATKSNALPDFDVQIGGGKNWRLNNGDDFSVLFSLGVDNERETILDSYRTVLNAAGGATSYRSDEDTFSTDLQTSALAALSYSFSNYSNIGYTMFYVRSAEDSFSRYTCDDDNISSQDIFGAVSTLHIYSLLNNQLSGEHKLSEKADMQWDASYATTASDEPDRKQILFNPVGDNRSYDGPVKLYNSDPSNNMRFFGALDEQEYNGGINLDFTLGDEEDKNEFSMGADARSKSRDFAAYKYNYKYAYDKTLPDGSKEPVNYMPTFDNIYDTSGAINQDHIANGDIYPDNGTLVNDKYFGDSHIYAGYFDVDYNVGKMLLNLGLRYEYSSQTIEYWDDSVDSFETGIEKGDIFPALNMKYSLHDKSSLRLAASRTVTRPSFNEMAPFLYQATTTSVPSRGNIHIQNGYNYNVDLRYELFKDQSTDMVSVTAYYKYLDTPIERTQDDAGGDVVYTFQNSQYGMAAGVEFEVRKQLFKDFKLGFNASYIYTDVTLEEGAGIQSETNRQLQGASPYLVNADATYVLRPNDDAQMTFSLIYNLQGPRIDAVGVNGLNNVMQEAYNSLNFIYNYKINSHLSAKVKVDNILGQDFRYTQKVKTTGEIKEVGIDHSYTGAQIGVSYNF